MNHTQSHVVVMVTAGNEDEVSRLANGLVGAGLAACVQILPIRSIYTWQGRLCDDREQLLLIKTRREALEELEKQVREMHSYEVPEITVVPIELGSLAYLGWIDELVGVRGKETSSSS